MHPRDSAGTTRRRHGVLHSAAAASKVRELALQAAAPVSADIANLLDETDPLESHYEAPHSRSEVGSISGVRTEPILISKSRMGESPSDKGTSPNRARPRIVFLVGGLLLHENRAALYEGDADGPGRWQDQMGQAGLAQEHAEEVPADKR